MIDDMAVYIANLGKYNEGYLVGAWFTFPIDEEDVKERIGLNEQYEEYAIHDTDHFPIAIGEYFCNSVTVTQKKSGQTVWTLSYRQAQRTRTGRPEKKS